MIILQSEWADWDLYINGETEISGTIGNPDAIGSGVEIDDLEEILPEMEDESQTEGLENLDKDMEPVAEEEKNEEVQEELEKEDEKSKEKAKEKNGRSKSKERMSNKINLNIVGEEKNNILKMK